MKKGQCECRKETSDTEADGSESPVWARPGKTVENTVMCLTDLAKDEISSI